MDGRSSSPADNSLSSRPTSEDSNTRNSYASIFNSLAVFTNYSRVSPGTEDILVSLEKPPVFKREDVLEAMKAAYEVGPREYEILTSQNVVNMMEMGCWGEANEDQDIVADYMEEVAFAMKKNGNPITVIRDKGDHFYDHGAPSPTDECFHTRLNKKYFDPANHPTLSKLTMTAALGNHDNDLCSKRMILEGGKGIARWIPFIGKLSSVQPATTGDDLAINQLAYHYLPEDNRISVKELRDMAQGDIKKLPEIDIENYAEKTGKHFFLPSFFYIQRYGKMKFYTINSTTFGREYFLARVTKKKGDCPKPLINQAIYILANMHEAIKEGFGLALDTHHPLEMLDHRKFDEFGDAELYMGKEEREELCEFLGLPTSCKSYNTMLLHIMMKEGVLPHLKWVTTAHNHAGSFINTLADPNASFPLVQIGAGAGGGKSQHRYNFDNQEDVGFYSMDKGFFVTRFDKTDPTLVHFTAYCIDTVDRKNGHRYKNYKAVPKDQQYELRFNNKSAEPLRGPEIDPRVCEFRALMLSVCKTYLSRINELQLQTKGTFLSAIPHLRHFNFSLYSLKHNRHDIETTHRIMNFLNRYTPSDFRTTVNAVFEISNHLSPQMDDEYMPKRIEKAIKNKYNKTLEELHNEVNEISIIMVPGNGK